MHFNTLRTSIEALIVHFHSSKYKFINKQSTHPKCKTTGEVEMYAFNERVWVCVQCVWGRRNASVVIWCCAPCGSLLGPRRRQGATAVLPPQLDAERPLDLPYDQVIRKTAPGLVIVDYLRLLAYLGREVLLRHALGLAGLHHQLAQIERHRIVLQLFGLSVQLGSAFGDLVLPVGAAAELVLGLDGYALAAGRVHGRLGLDGSAPSGARGYAPAPHLLPFGHGGDRKTRRLLNMELVMCDGRCVRSPRRRDRRSTRAFYIRSYLVLFYG